MQYQHKTTPFKHQVVAFELSRDREEFALFCEQGTGKSKIVLDTAAWLYARGEIDALLVIAPNGVQRNWIVNELPTHLPDHCHAVAAYWTSAPRKAERQALDALWNPKRQGLRVLAMNVEAFSTERSKTYSKKFLHAFRCLMVVDESSRIKNNNPRTKALIAAGKLSPYRRILTGTPVTQSPLDAYTQFKFLDENILGFSSQYAFKNRYAEMLPAHHPLVRHISRGSRFTPQLIATNPDGTKRYQNLDELKAKMSPHSFRVTKVECLDLPPKVYERRYVELTSDQRRLYEKLKKDFVAEFGGGQINAALAMTRMMRLQQITGGFAPVLDEVGNTIATHPVGKTNPKIDALLELLEETEGKVIIWARFRKELELIANALRKEFGAKSVVEYHGKVSNADRQAAVDGFQSPDAQSPRFFVGQQHSGGIGLTLTAAATVIYFSNDFSLETRLQSEDRAHRIGQQKSVTYIDIEAVDTLDRKVIDALRSKKDMADVITGDDPRQWL
ncbi:MAG: DEAD/DEAH box helicase [Gallionella sp.]